MIYPVYAVALLSGAVLMGLEMVGSRVLAPLFGSSIFVWGSLIGIVLTALSLGYYAGGYLADRYPRLTAASSVLGVAGVWIGLIPVLARVFLPGIASGASGVSGVSGTLCASLVLFFVPSVLLATISPWCVRLSISRLEKAGRTTGVLYAVSNVGSIAGTFVTSFYLIPRIGVDSILRWMSILLLLMAVILAAFSRTRRILPVGLLLCALLASSLGGRYLVGASEAGVIYETQSLYHHIYVIEEEGKRLLKFDKSIQSGMFIERPYDSAYPYTDYFHLALAMKDDIEDVLMIGLGAGTVPKRFQRDYPGMNIECVEIDPEVARVARRYFGFPEDDEVRVHTIDGRIFLQNTDKRYDLIIVDAYYADAIPFHLATAEFYELARSRLKPGGVLASNLIGALEGRRSSLFRSMFLTLDRVFPETYVFPVDYSPGTEASLRNIEVFAVAPGRGAGVMGMNRAELLSRAQTLEGDAVILPAFSSLLSYLYEKPIAKEGAVLLTDDYAPVDSLLYLY